MAMKPFLQNVKCFANAAARVTGSHALMLRRMGISAFVMIAFLVAHSGSATAMANCAVNPSSCGFPDKTNTGARKVSAFKRIPQDIKKGPGWYWDSRGWIVINKNGTTFSNFIIDTDLSVEADNVVIHDVIITSNGLFGIALRHADNVRIERCTIGPPLSKTRLTIGIKDVYGDALGAVVTQNHIFNTSTAIQMEQGLITDNYITDMGYLAGDHINGILSTGSKKLLEIRHNTIFNRFSQTDAIGLFEDFDVQANRVVDNNLIAGGGYTLYAGQNPGGPRTYNIKVTNNRFAVNLYGKAGYWGPATAHNKYGSGNIWSNNVWDYNNAVVPAPNN